MGLDIGTGQELGGPKVGGIGVPGGLGVPNGKEWGPQREENEGK